ncbi:hypothetical protein EBU99_10735 [bacterium]|nr:hypothetical protein [bacterium]
MLSSSFKPLRLQTQRRSLLKSMTALLVLGNLAAACVAKTPAPESQEQSLESAAEAAAQISESVKCILPSPQWYKNLWLDLNDQDNLLGRNLMTHYMSCTGGLYRLSEAEFRSLPVRFFASNSGATVLSRAFIEEQIKHRISPAGTKIIDVDETLIAATSYGNTLGNFQLQFKGTLVWRQNSDGDLVPHFQGHVQAKDRYDFNPSDSKITDSWRGRDTEVRVRIAHVGLPGKAFDVESAWLPLEFDYPSSELGLIQDGGNGGKSGYSAYGEQVQLILMTELRTSRWEKSSNLEKLKILIKTLKRLHAAVAARE